MDIDKQAMRLYLLPLFLIATVGNVAGSIGHPPGLVPAPVVYGWTKYVPQNVPPHAWTSTYYNTGLKVLPPPPYYAPAYPQPVPVPQPVVPIPQPIYPVAPAVPAPVAPILPTPTFNSNPPLLPAPGIPLLPSPANTPVFRTPYPVPYPKPEDPLTFPVASGPQPTVPNCEHPPPNFTPSGYPVSGNYLSPVVAYPGRRPVIGPVRVTRPYSVHESHEPQQTYGPPSSPYPSSPYPASPYPPKYRPSPSETYGPPSFNGNREYLREYSSQPSVSHIVRVVRPRYASEFRR